MRTLIRGSRLGDRPEAYADLTGYKPSKRDSDQEIGGARGFIYEREYAEAKACF